jgi:hypothetical protein
MQRLGGMDGTWGCRLESRFVSVGADGAAFLLTRNYVWMSQGFSQRSVLAKHIHIDASR